MSVASKTNPTNAPLVTAEQMARMDLPGCRLELVEGVVRTMSPAGNEHGQIASRIDWKIGPFAAENRLGITYAAETGFLVQRNPDTVRAPDFAFVTQQHVDDVGSVSGYWPGPPDLAVEVVSPHDAFSDVEAKALAWLAAGSQLVWVVDPQQKHVTVYRSSDDIRILTDTDRLTAPDLLPGWELPVIDLFPE